MQPMQPLMTCEQVAERYGVKKETVWSWIRNGKLKALKLQKNYRVRQEDIIEFENNAATDTLPTA